MVAVDRVLSFERGRLQTVCKACVLLEGLNKGLPGLGIRRVKGHPVP